ncbi:MAG: Mg(2+) transporter [Bogoriella megaspora]|nr:MAG: Mg(2+) transporter [Bogoriella megaspora]
MSDSPRSHNGETRFSTPVSELDDHRHQPEHLPRADTSAPGTRRGTLASINTSRPDLLEINAALEGQTSATRDFYEHAIDDDHSGRLSVRDGSPTRQASHSPNVRRNTGRRRHHSHTAQQGDRRTIRSRGSSKNSKSSSSADNSVDAFAGPRRNRAGTVNSKQPSEIELTRTISGGTHQRRPTFSEGPKTATHRDDEDSNHGSVEEDVCFPSSDDEDFKNRKIDYEELDEFVATSQLKSPSIRAQTKYFPDLRPSATNGSSNSDVKKEKAQAVDVENADILASIGQPCERIDSLQATDQARWSFFSSELDNAIHANSLGDLLMPGENFRDLFEPAEESGGVWWLDMVNLSEEEVNAISKAFNIHRLTREDILTQESREKVELFKDYYFMCFRSFYQASKDSEKFLDPLHVYAVVFREGLLTFTFAASPHTSNVRQRISRLRDYVALSADWVCYALIDDIVDSFGPVIQDVEKRTDAIEDSVFNARFEDYTTILRSIGDCRKKVMTLMRLLYGKADVIKGFAKRCNEQYSVAPRGDVGLYLSDIQDHVVTMMSNLNHFEKMLSRAHSNYLGQISVESITQGNRTNDTLSKITLLATILVPLNLVCGLFGMNVKVPGRDTDTLAWWFGILGVMIGFAVFCMLAAKKFRFI